MVSHAAGVAAVIDASFVKVTVNGLFALPLAPTVIADVNVCALPVVAVEKFQRTLLVDVVQPACAVVSAEVVKPPAKVALVGRFTPVNVTGYGFGLLIVNTTSPLPPGKSWFVAAGEETALRVRF